MVSVWDLMMERYGRDLGLVMDFFMGPENQAPRR